MIINKNLRLVIIAAFLSLAVIICGLLYLEVGRPKMKEEASKLYEYKQTSKVETQVIFKPNNILYGNGSSDTGVYLTLFSDYIKAVFDYEFIGEEPAEFSGKYNVVAVLEGYLDGEKEQKTLWKKDFVLVPETLIKDSGEKLSISRELPLKIEQYNNFAKKIMNDSKVTSPVKLTVFMNVSLKAKTDEGSTEEKASPAFAIPLNRDFFEIAKGEVGDKTGAIEETRQVKMPINKALVTGYGIALVVLLIGLIYVGFFTVSERKDPLAEQLNRIFKKHGDRLVALNCEIAAATEQAFKAKTIEDLVRIADEIGQPIMYKYSSDSKAINRFFVFDNGSMYIFDLKEGMEGIGVKVSEKTDSGRTVSW